MPLDLSNVTLWACVWSPDDVLIHKTFRAVRHCTRLAKFGEVIFFCCKDPGISNTCGWKVITVPRMDMRKWNVFVNRTVPKHIRTPYAMSVHEDGFILDESLWDDEFLKYDYIGAPWPDGVVGNQGFCIESKRMLEAKLSLPVSPEEANTASDLLICRVHRHRLERNGIRFAPKQVAEMFSTELYGDDQPSFGFHGKNVCKRKYPLGWSKICETEKPRNVGIAYPFVIKPVSTSRQEFDDCSRRFAESYRKFPAGRDHTLYVVCSNGPRDASCEEIFKGIDVVFEQYEEMGWDIGSEQYIARKMPEEFFVGMTTRSYFHREGWLRRFMEARNSLGEGLYGAAGSFENSPHIRTAFYGVDSWIYREYPHTIDTRDKGFFFESLNWNFTKFVEDMGYPCIMVTWDGFYQKQDWRKPKNIFRSGNQKNMLAWDRHSLIYEQSDRTMKDHLRLRADGLRK